MLLQAAASLARSGRSVAYVTGEEAEAQVQERARRLGAGDAPVQLAAETDLRKILDGLKALRPDVVIVDSIQTVWADGVEAAPGTVAQVRACAHELVRFAKKTGAIVILVGHVTKDGQIAGPRVVEHLVDAVIYFEGERGMPFRILRAVKNRYGPTDEIGVFEMVEAGPGGNAESFRACFLAVRASGHRARRCSPASRARGRCWWKSRRSPRQALTARRGAQWLAGIRARLAMILAVLETRCGLSFSGRDVYLSVAGGLRITEPAADLAVAAALISALADRALPKHCVVFGEVALSGEVRPAGRSDLRLKEARQAGI